MTDGGNGAIFFSILKRRRFPDMQAFSSHDIFQTLYQHILFLDL